MPIAPPISAATSIVKLFVGLAAPVCREAAAVVVPVAAPAVAPALLLEPLAVGTTVSVMTSREPFGSVDVSRTSDSTAPPPG